MVDGRYTYFMVLINQHTHTTEWGKHLLEDHPISQLLIGMILQVGRGRVGRFWNLREHETQKKWGKGPVIHWIIIILFPYHGRTLLQNGDCSSGRLGAPCI